MNEKIKKDEEAVTDEIDKMLGLDTEVSEIKEDESDIKADEKDEKNDTPTKDDTRDDIKDTDADDPEKVEDDKVVNDDKGDEKGTKPTKDDEVEDDKIKKDDKDTLIESLRKQIEDGHITPDVVVDPAKPAEDDKSVIVLYDKDGKVVETRPVEKKEEEKVATPDPVDFIGDIKLDDLLDTKEGLNKLLNLVYNAGIKISADDLANSRDGFVRSAVEESARKLPGMITNHVTRQSTVNDLVDDFYRENEDLIKFKQTVSAAANQVHAEHSDWQISDIFKEAAVVTRKSLGLPTKSTEDNKDDKNNRERNPAFVKDAGKSRSNTSINLKGVAKEIDDLINIQ